MNDLTVSIIDKDLPMNEDFYKRLEARMIKEGVKVSYFNELCEASKESSAVLLAVPLSMEGIDNAQIVLGLRTINRRERLQVAEQVVSESLIARWASPETELELAEVLSQWGSNSYVFKYDWSAGRRGVKLLQHGSNGLPEDYASDKDIVMEYLDDDPYTYKADLCCGVLLNAWFLRTVSITEDNFNAYTRDPAQYELPEEVQCQLERLSTELMKYGAGYISIDMMKYKGKFKIIEINTNSVGRNISWQHFGDTYLNTYPEGIKQLLNNLSTLPTLGDIRCLKSQINKIMSLTKPVD
jgi:hypothetical protein